MEPDRTDLTWSYDPKDFFEARYEGVYHDWKLAIEDGRIAASVLGGPPSEASEAAISSFVRSVFQTRAMQTRRPFRLDQRANLIEYRGDTQNQTIRIGIADCVVVRDQLDFQIVDAASGTVIRDSKAERIAEETAEINGLSAKAQRHPVLQGMLASYSMAIGDPANELTHLYEIRDALAKYFRSDTTAKRSLQITSSDWSTFGRLANEEPLFEGRHRGKHSPSLRHATGEELDIVRDLAKEWLRRFAAML